MRVTAIFPGAIAANTVASSGLQVASSSDSLSQRLKPYPAAATVRDMIDGIERDAYHVLVGRDGSAVPQLPQRAAAFIYKQMRGLLESF